MESGRAEAPGQGHLPPPGEVGEQPGPEVTGRVDRVAGVGAQRRADREYREPDDQRRQVRPGQRVPAVRDGHDQDEQERRAHYFVDQRPDGRSGVVLGRERGEDRVRRQRLAPALRGFGRQVERVDGLVVNEEQQSGRDERAEHLRNHVGTDAAPPELAPYGQRNGDGRVDVSAAHAAGHIDPHTDGEPPSERDQQPVARRIEDGRGSRRAP